MTHLFYFVGIFFLIYEIYYLATLSRRYHETRELTLAAETNKDKPKPKNWGEFSEKQKRLFLRAIFVAIPFLMWMVTGLLSSQWIIFLSLLIFELLIMRVFQKIAGISPARYLVMLISTCALIVGILFIIINKYHLHIDTYQWVLNLFQK